MSAITRTADDRPLEIAVYLNGLKSMSGTAELAEIITDIKSNSDLKKQIEAIRSEPDKDIRGALKKKLPAMQASAGEAGAGRRAIQHSGLCQIDVDHIGFKDASELRDKLEYDSHVAAAFVSPSGDGLKVLLAIPAAIESHPENWKAAARYFHETYSHQPDPSTKDTSRLCFLSHDPDAWHKQAEPLDCEAWREVAEEAAPPESEAAPTATCTRNDAGRAERFVNRYGADIRFVPDRGVWLTWETERWTLDRDGARERLAIQLSREMLSDAARIPGTDEAAAKARAAAVQEALACGDRRNIADFIALAQVDRRILLPVEKLDADPWLVAAKNAVIDLRTGEARTFTREDYITKTLGCDAADVECPRWERFMEEVFPDEAVRRYAWKAAGYSLTGDMREQCFFFLHGTGHNGKTKFVETLEYVLGGLCTRAGKGIVTANQRGDYPLREVADLAGARMILTSETEEGERLNEGVIKDITGGDTLRAEHKYERSFTLRPTCKLWIIGNHKPSIKGTDGGIWRRVRLIPFTQKFEGTADDRNLGETLKSEASGILSWLIRGALLWRAEGLEAPEAITAATTAYRTEEDTLGDFLDERTVEAPDGGVPHGDVFRAYQSWAVTAGVRYPLNSKMLSKKLRDRGWRDMRTASAKCFWRSVRLEEV